MNRSTREWFRTTVDVRQGCLLSPTLFGIFLEWILTDALEEHDGKVSIGGRNTTNLRFADDIDALAEEEQELEALVDTGYISLETYKSYKQTRAFALVSIPDFQLYWEIFPVFKTKDGIIGISLNGPRNTRVLFMFIQVIIPNMPPVKVKQLSLNV